MDWYDSFPNNWSKIADKIGSSRNPKECAERYKFLLNNSTNNNRDEGMTGQTEV